MSVVILLLQLKGNAFSSLLKKLRLILEIKTVDFGGPLSLTIGVKLREKINNDRMCQMTQFQVYITWDW